MLTVDYEHCTGCGACIQRCPKYCITWEKREFGFKYPAIDSTQCIECGLCGRVCPAKQEGKEPEIQKVYAAVIRDKDVLRNSTSGGVFTALAADILNRDGVIYGCSLEQDFTVKHVRVEKQDQLSKLRGSKYVQSDLGDSFQRVEEDLRNGRLVLFSGTPCQIAGLRNYLGSEFEKLICVDIVCHGVGSQDYFDKNMEFLKSRRGTVVGLRFRSKEYVGWSCGGVIVSRSARGDEQITHPFYNYNNFYYHYYLDGEIYRRCCYSCRFANTDRIGDLTLGDFWGVERLKLDMDFYDGCSLVIVNTMKGLDLIDRCKDSIDMCQASINDAIKHNAQLSRPSGYKEERTIRLREFNEMNGEEIQKKYIRNNIPVIVKGWVKRCVPYKLKLKIRGLL